MTCFILSQNDLEQVSDIELKGPAAQIKIRFFSFVILKQ